MFFGPLPAKTSSWHIHRGLSFRTKERTVTFLPTCTLNKFEIIVTFETLEDTMMTFELFIPG